MPYHIRFPALAILVPPVRLARALGWLLRYDRATFARLVALSPMYLAGATSWALSFVRGLRAVRDEERAQPFIRDRVAEAKGPNRSLAGADDGGDRPRHQYRRGSGRAADAG
jgi:hypothetical protein